MKILRAVGAFFTLAFLFVAAIFCDDEKFLELSEGASEPDRDS